METTLKISIISTIIKDIFLPILIILLLFIICYRMGTIIQFLTKINTKIAYLNKSIEEYKKNDIL